jgi:hypothetical protein
MSCSVLRVIGFELDSLGFGVIIGLVSPEQINLIGSLLQLGAGLLAVLAVILQLTPRRQVFKKSTIQAQGRVRRISKLAAILDSKLLKNGVSSASALASRFLKNSARPLPRQGSGLSEEKGSDAFISSARLRVPIGQSA